VNILFLSPEELNDFLVSWGCETVSKFTPCGNDEYYVYIYCDPVKNKPIYVGMGKGSRYEHHYRAARRNCKREPNKHKLNTIKKIIKEGREPIIYVVAGFEIEVARNLEVWLIEKLGRADIGTGPLTNLTSGGEGHTGAKPWNHGKKLVPIFQKRTYKLIEKGKVDSFLVQGRER